MSWPLFVCVSVHIFDCLGGLPRLQCCASECLCLDVLLRPGRFIYDPSLARSSTDGEVDGGELTKTKNNRQVPTDARLHKDTVNIGEIRLG